jgi:hypothetical protein
MILWIKSCPGVMKMLPMFLKVAPIFVPCILQMTDSQIKKMSGTKTGSHSATLFVTFSSLQSYPHFSI